MKSAIIGLVAGLVGGLACGSAALGVNVLVISSTSQVVDDAVVAALKAGGHSAVIGPAFAAFTGAVDLSGYDVVYFQANVNWTDIDMPTDGQQVILDFVRSGGGLVTCEWVSFKTYSGSFQKFRAMLPGVYRGYTGAPLETFTKVTPDAVLNKGLPDAFDFPLDSFSGTEGWLQPKCSAIEFYHSATEDAGVVGWNYNVGRVLSISTVNGATQVADPEFGVLLSNAMSWAALAGGKPGDGYTSDCDGNGVLDLFDFLCFTNAFNAGQPVADCDGDGDLTLFDFLCFVNTFNKEC